MKMKIKMKVVSRILGTVSILALSEPVALADVGEAGAEFTLQEIIVTAQRRSQSLQDVAMGITAFSGLEMERAGDVTFEDFAVRIPNLSFGATNDGAISSRSIAIRGIFGVGTTGFYIDDTPMQESMSPLVLDLERVEVLRGPQGTLYGARSMGGTVRFITKQPNLNELEVRGHAGMSNTTEGGLNYLVDAAVNMPIVEDKVALRVLGYYQYQEGLFERVHSNYEPFPGLVLPTPEFDDKENVDDFEVHGFQAAVKVAANDWLTVNGRVNYQNAKLDGFPFSDFETGSFTNRRAFDLHENSEDKWLHATASFNADLNMGSLIGTFSHWDRDTRDREDVSELMSWLLFFAGIESFLTPLEADNVATTKINGEVAEIRFASDFDGSFQIVTGGFYSTTKVEADYLNVVPGLSDAIDAFFGAPAGTDVFGIDDLGFSQDFDSTIQEVALFGEASMDLTENLTVTAGLRWFETTIDVDGMLSGFAGGPVSPGNAKESGINPKFAVEYSYSDDGMVYASAAKGYRRGGVNAAPVEFCDDAPASKIYESDSLWSYEVGTKNTFADNKVQLNAAAFIIDWNNMQQNVTLACGFGATLNTGAARSKGFEIETSFVVAEGFVVDAALGYTDAKVTDAGLSVSPISVPGTKIEHVPEWTFSTSAEYTFALSGDVEGRLRADFSYIGDSISYSNAQNPDPVTGVTRKAVNLLNLRGTIMLENWEVSLFADNLLNEISSLGDSISLSLELPGRPRFQQNRPRTLGVEARFNF